MKQFL
jgi:hypothetical protein